EMLSAATRMLPLPVVLTVPLLTRSRALLPGPPWAVTATLPPPDVTADPLPVTKTPELEPPETELPPMPVTATLPPPDVTVPLSVTPTPRLNPPEELPPVPRTMTVPLPPAL